MTALAVLIGVGACSSDKNRSDTTTAGGDVNATGGAGASGAGGAGASGTSGAATSGAMTGGAADSTRRMDSLRTDSINRRTKTP
jgi:hypothetical protein